MESFWHVLDKVMVLAFVERDQSFMNVIHYQHMSPKLLSCISERNMQIYHLGRSIYPCGTWQSPENSWPLYTRAWRPLDPWYTNHVNGQEAGHGPSSLYTRPRRHEGTLIDEKSTWHPTWQQADIISWPTRYCIGPIKMRRIKHKTKNYDNQINCH